MPIRGRESWRELHRTCRECGKEITVSYGYHRIKRYCSDACRQRYHRRQLTLVFPNAPVSWRR